MRSAVLLLAPMLMLSACGSKNGPSAAASMPQGWQKAEGMRGECYYPPKWDSLGVGDRKMARMNALNAMMEQWKGARGDSVKIQDKVAVNVETVLLGRPENIEEILVGNLEQCEGFMKGTGNLAAWEGWLSTLPGKLTEGECAGSLLPNTLYDYLNIGGGWQIPAPICEGQRIRVSASPQDYYQVEEDGPWINAGGDTSQPASGDLPCTTEGCFVGQVVMKFVDYDGVETVLPVGEELVFTAPAHGEISVTVNDITYFNNVFKTENGIQHHTSIEYQPAE